MRPCFAFSAKTSSTPAVLALDEDIGFWGTQAVDFRNQLDQVDGGIVVEINSLGGDVMSGLGIYNMLRNHAAKGHKVTTRVTGVAASIASIIMLAGDDRQMPSNAFAMVHAVRGDAFGTADELRAQAEVVDKVQASLRNIYISRMDVDEATAIEIMSKDTWLSAEECLELGLVNSVVDPVRATAKFDLVRADLPDHVAAVFKNQADPTDLTDPTLPTDPADPTNTPEPEAPNTPVAESIVAEASNFGLEAHAAHFALNFASLSAAKAQMGVAREITALCKVVNKPDQAAALIRGGKTVAEARATLANLLAASDEQIDNTPKITNGPTGTDPAKPAVVSPTSLWASHNSQKKEGR